jgi:anthranilate synthase component 1
VLSTYKTVTVPGVPPFQGSPKSYIVNCVGGAIGYVSYDCIRYFEPKTARPLKDILHIPEAVLMLHDSVIAFDNLFQTIKVISHVHIPSNHTPDELHAAYLSTVTKIRSICDLLNTKNTPNPPQPQIILGREYTSNIGQTGYENHVKTLKKYIIEGQIIQAVPSQRLARPTSLHPFNVYRHLRTVNPSPYMFYIDCGDFQLVGASPEMLVKSDNGRIITHPIAGTVRRGETAEEDDKLASSLQSSSKDRAEHIMLVDLARNDVNRVCDPLTTSVDRLMTVERFSHVSHLVSQVSGVLRKGKTRFDAFRSIFPAGTVSGAPKVRAMELIGELEGEKRGVYAGAVGRWGFEEDSMDTCLALRTMTFKDGVAYLQAGMSQVYVVQAKLGGGIVYDSDPYEEYVETLNKLKSNITTIQKAEELYARMQEGENDVIVEGEEHEEKPEGRVGKGI